MAKKNSLYALNDHLMERIEWVTDKDIKGEELDEEIKRSDTVSKLAAQVISNAHLILRANVEANKSDGIIKLPLILEDK